VLVGAWSQLHGRRACGCPVLQTARGCAARLPAVHLGAPGDEVAAGMDQLCMLARPLMQTRPALSQRPGASGAAARAARTGRGAHPQGPVDRAAGAWGDPGRAARLGRRGRRARHEEQARLRRAQRLLRLRRTGVLSRGCRVCRECIPYPSLARHLSTRQGALCRCAPTQPKPDQALQQQHAQDAGRRLY